MLWESDLPIENVKRLQRQIVVPKIKIEGQLLLNNTSVLIVGMGGLGSPVLMYLATTGIKRIGIVDYDKIELHNLQRQVIHNENDLGDYKTKSARQFAQNLNSTVEIIEHNEYLDINNVEKIVMEYDVIADCCDSIELRYLLNDTCRIMGKRLVCASVLKWEGQICVISSRDACYRCIFPDPKTNAPNCERSGVLGPVCGIIGSMQATEVVKLILNDTNSKDEHGNLIIYNAYSNIFNYFRKKYKKCIVCTSNKMPIASNFQSCSTPKNMGSLSWSTIVKDFSKYKIIDIRASEHFGLFRIKNSVNIPASVLLEEHNVEKIKRFDEPIILSCYKGVTSMDKVKILKDMGINAYSSCDGIEGFKNFIGFNNL